jgi:hypothetical protein
MYLLLGIGAAVIAGAWAYGASMIGKPRDTSDPKPQAPVVPVGSGQPPVIVAPPIPTLPPVAPGTIPSLPPPGSILPQLDKVAADFLDQFVLQDPMSPIVAGDLVNVDLSKAGIPVPANIPVIGKVYMTVKDLKVNGDGVPPKLLWAEFVSPEFRVLGPQVVRREACERINDGPTYIRE